MQKAVKGGIIGILISLVLITIGNISFLNSPFEAIHRRFSDKLLNRNEPSSEIIIISIDDKSTQPYPEGYGKLSQWSRERFVELLDVLKKENPKVITFDLLFRNYTQIIPAEKLNELKNKTKLFITGNDKLKEYENFINSYSVFPNPIDSKFAEKLSEFSNIVLSASFDVQRGLFIPPLEEFSKNVHLGFSLAPMDEDGIIRATVPIYSIDNKVYEDMGVATLKEYLGKEDLNLPAAANEKMTVNLFADPYGFKMIPFVDVVRGRYERGVFQNKIVLIGVTSAKEIHDEYYTARDNSVPMSGIEFRANEIQTILEGKFLNNQSKLSQIITLLLISLVLTVVFSYLGIWYSLLLVLFTFGAYIAAAHLFYRRGLLINMVYPFLAIILSYIAAWVYRYFVADKSKREIKSAFAHYVSEDLVNEISDKPEMAHLGGEKRMCTVLFADIKDSTKLSEKAEITSWVSQLNEYFTVMEKVIKRFHGTIDKYEGDAIMAFWNAPVAENDHVRFAYCAALEMQKVLKILNQKWHKEGKPELQIRIGINTGEVIVGNIGSVDRFNYTVMGDTVNTASRLESSANKVYGTSILVSGAEMPLVGLITREVDLVYLPGKNEPVKIHEVLCTEKEKTAHETELVTKYTEALALYRKKDFEKAGAIFASLDDPVSKVMADRCKNMEGVDDQMAYKIRNK